MSYPIGTRVRIVHHTRPGTVIGPVYLSEVEKGAERQDVWWDIRLPDEPVEHVTGWNPCVLVPLEQPIETDPPFVLNGPLLFAAAGIFDDGPFIGKIDSIKLAN